MSTATINSNTGILKYNDNVYEVGSYEYYQVINQLNKIRYIGDSYRDSYTLWRNKNYWTAKKRVNNVLRAVYVGLSESMDNCHLKKISELVKLSNLDWYRHKRLRQG